MLSCSLQQNEIYKGDKKKDKGSTVYTTEYQSKRNQTIKLRLARLQVQHQGLNLLSIDKSFSQDRHRVLGPTHRRAIKEESKVANHDWVDHQKCSLF